MKFHSGNADTFVPDGTSLAQALARTTHLGIGAHADDLEILAWPGIARCYRSPDNWFSGVVVTDGAGSPRADRYADYSDAQMAVRRREEQRSAAALGEYSAVLQLGYASSVLKSKPAETAAADLLNILNASRPRVVYLHNLADSHGTHVAVALASIEALRKLPRGEQPAELYGIEIWRNLDWLPTAYRSELEVDSANPLQGKLLREFDSQINGGKRYDLAVAGRQVANATFSRAHSIDRFQASVLAMDLLPLLHNPTLTPGKFLQDIVNHFSDELLGELRQ